MSTSKNWNYASDLLDEYFRHKKAGNDATIGEFAESYRHQPQGGQEVLPVVEFLEDAYSDIVQSDSLPMTLGNYALRRVVGIGGMGTVYEANHDLRSRVAVKVMGNTGGESSDVRFEREAQIAADLHHPNIVPVYEYGVIEQMQYMSMKFIDGWNLAQIMNCTESETSAEDACFLELPGDWKQVARIGQQIAEALEYAHSHGVLHRDIKPANILVDKQGNAWISDFGLAMMKDQSRNITRAGCAVGTLRYMAPEQLINQSDERSDVFGLGLTLLELAHGESSARVAGRNPSTIPDKFLNVLKKACADEPDQRFQSAAEFAKALRNLCEEGQSPTTGFSRWLTCGLAATVILLLGFGSASDSTAEPTESPATMVTFEASTGLYQVVSTLDDGICDAEQWLNGKMYIRSTDLEFVWDDGNQLVGIQFPNMPIPKGAEIVSAHIQFTCDESDIGETNLNIRAELGESLPFDNSDYNLSNRQPTVSTIEWHVEKWMECHRQEAQRTPDLKSIVSEVVRQDDWTSGDAITILIDGEGKRCATSADECGDYIPPQITIAYRLVD